MGNIRESPTDNLRIKFMDELKNDLNRIGNAVSKKSNHVPLLGTRTTHPHRTDIGVGAALAAARLGLPCHCHSGQGCPPYDYPHTGRDKPCPYNELRLG